MTTKTTYDVKREHLGDKAYVTGDTRDLDPNDAKHLIELGVLEESKQAQKSDSAPANKARKAVPENK